MKLGSGGSFEDTLNSFNKEVNKLNSNLNIQLEDTVF
jgi:hypothetical protein